MQARVKRSIMHAMEESALFISALALIVTVLLAGFGMLFQLLVSRDTRQQGTEIRKDVADFKTEAGQILGEIRGLTADTREAQRDQVSKMLDMIAQRTTAVTSSGTADIVDRIDAIEAAVEEQAPAEVSLQLESLRQLVRELPEAIGRSVQPRAWYIGSERTLSELGKTGSLRLILNHQELARGGSLRIYVVAEDTGVGPLHVSCGVTTPSGRMFSKKLPAVRGGGRGEPFAAFEYPFDYPDADTNEVGEYIVTGQLWGGMAGMNLVQRKDIGFRVLP